jgi:hypothetical protein
MGEEPLGRSLRLLRGILGAFSFVELEAPLVGRPAGAANLVPSTSERDCLE